MFHIVLLEFQAGRLKYDFNQLETLDFSPFPEFITNKSILFSQDDVDGTPPTFSQLSRSDSGSSYQSPTSSQQSSGGATGINAVRFTLRRTVSLEKKSYHHNLELA